MEIGETKERPRLPRQGGDRLPQGSTEVESAALGPAPSLPLDTSPSRQGFTVPADKAGVAVDEQDGRGLRHALQAIQTCGTPA